MKRCLSLLFVAAVGNAASFTVDLNGSGDFTEIQQAVDAAVTGDTVLVKPGEYVITAPLHFNGKAITCASEAGAENTTILMADNPDDPKRSSVVIFESGEDATTIFAGFTVTGGRGTQWGDESYGTGGGGVLCINGSSPTLERCTIERNSAEFGGGIYCGPKSDPLFTNTTISGNIATGCSGDGESPLGGGISCSESSSIITNCLIVKNSATGPYAMGGGIYCTDASPIIASCTIAQNSAEYQASGVSFSCASLPSIFNSIIWDNAGGSFFCSTPTVSFSCIEGETILRGEGNINFNPRFAGSGDFHLQEGSPCIDTGTTARALTFDIEGNGRPCGAGIDMGTYETGSCPVPEEAAFIRGDVTADRSHTIADAVFLLHYLFTGGEPPPCLDAADADDDGRLSIADPLTILFFQFGDGDLLPTQFPTCGMDSTKDALDCQRFPPCELLQN